MVLMADKTRKPIFLSYGILKSVNLLRESISFYSDA